MATTVFFSAPARRKDRDANHRDHDRHQEEFLHPTGRSARVFVPWSPSIEPCLLESTNAGLDLSDAD